MIKPRNSVNRVDVYRLPSPAVILVPAGGFVIKYFSILSDSGFFR
jgi:hypothetical protein